MTAPKVLLGLSVATALGVGIAHAETTQCAERNAIHANQEHPQSTSVEAANIRIQVRNTIDRIARLPPGKRSAPTQQALFDQLVGLGPKAAPTIIELMDDRRRLPVAALALENRSPNAFEALRHYSPALMVDALSAVLSQITGESFGFIENSANDKVSEADRRKVVEAWRRYSVTHYQVR